MDKASELSGLIVYLEKKRRECETSLGIKDWVGLSAKFLVDEIYAALERGTIRPGAKVLDLGSGNGSSYKLWEWFGFYAAGIDLHQPLVDFSHRLIEGRCYSGKSIDVFCGSYYPKEYIDYRESNGSRVKDIESKLSHGKEQFHPVCDEDTYRRNGLDIREFGIFHAYLWAIQVPSVSEMFLMHAKDDAIIFMPFQDSLAKKCGLKRISEHFYGK